MFVIQTFSDPLDRLISSNVTNDVAAEYDSTKTYVTGDICKVTDEGTVYKCIADSITVSGVSVPVKGLYPTDYLVSTEATYPWMELRSINKTAMFDGYLNTLTQSDTGLIEVELQGGGCDSVALFNVAARTVTITVYDNRGNQVYQEARETYKIVSTLDDYFFSDVEFTRTLIFSFGLGIGGTIKVSISNPDGSAQCGMCLIGKKVYLGYTKDEVELPIIDYSQYKTDTLGRTKLSEGLYADLCTFTLYLPEDVTGKSFHTIRSILTSLRGKLSVWCVDNTDKTWEFNPALAVCGYYTDLSTNFNNTLPYCDMKITGVV